MSMPVYGHTKPSRKFFLYILTLLNGLIVQENSTDNESRYK